MDYQKHYDKLIERARNRLLESYTEKHHIIPQCMNGTDESINLISLTPEEHYVAHQLLVKIYPNELKLVYAAKMMTIGENRNNKLYGWLRLRFSESMKGENHPNWGKRSMSLLKGKTYEEIHGEEKAKILKKQCSERMKGNVPTQKNREAVSKACKGKPSPIKGIKWTKEQKAKLKNRIPWNKGKTGLYSEEYKQKLSEAKKGTIRKQEDKDAIRLAMKNKIWIVNLQTTERKRINKDIEIPEGWKRGKNL